MEKAKDGFHSTKAIGQSAPDFERSVVLNNGVRVPTGVCVVLNNGVRVPTGVCVCVRSVVLNNGVRVPTGVCVFVRRVCVFVRRVCVLSCFNRYVCV